MGTLRIEKGKDTEAGAIFLYEGEQRLQEVFAESADLSERDLRALGYVPCEDLFPGQVIAGYAELGQTLYAAAWE